MLLLVRRTTMMMYQETSNTPGQIEAALQYLRFAEEIRSRQAGRASMIIPITKPRPPMNPENTNPRPQTQPTPDVAPGTSESGCGILPQSVQGASRSDVSTPTPHPPARSFYPEPPQYPMDPEPYFDFDFEEAERERELLLEELAAGNEDFSRSSEEGWYYSDED